MQSCPEITPGRLSKQRLSGLTSLFCFICADFSLIGGSFWHQIHPKTAEDEDGDPKKQNGREAIQGQGCPEAPTVSEHPREDQKHRQGGEDEPKGSFGVIGKALRRLAALVHPNHGQQGREGEGDEKRGEPVAEQLDFIDE